MDYVYDGVICMGVLVIKRSGGFYIFRCIEWFGMSCFDFCMEVLERRRVGVVGGCGFCGVGEGYVGVSYGY